MVVSQNGGIVKIVYDFPLSPYNLVFRLEILLEIDAELIPREVLHMPYGRFHDEIFSQIPSERFSPWWETQQSIMT